MAVFQGKRPFPWAQGLCRRVHATIPTNQQPTIHQNHPIPISVHLRQSAAKPLSASPRLRGEYSFAIGGCL